MKSIQHFELDRNTAARYDAVADCCLRVTSGRVWLTIVGRSTDVWLDAGAEYAVAQGSTIWLSAEPDAAIAIVSRSMSAAARPVNMVNVWRWLTRAGGVFGVRRGVPAG